MYQTSAKSSTRPGPRLVSSDEALWASVQGGEHGAFDELYRRHERSALRVAGRICGPGAAEDAVQAAFLAVWRSRSGFDPSLGSFRSWVLTAVRNRAIDVVREQRRRRVHQASEGGFPELADPRLTDSEFATRETGAAVRKAVAGLPAEQRRVIELAYFGEFSHTEIASQLRIPLGTVKGRTRLALKKLPGSLAAHRRQPLAAV